MWTGAKVNLTFSCHSPAMPHTHTDLGTGNQRYVQCNATQYNRNVVVAVPHGVDTLSMAEDYWRYLQ